MAHRPRKKRLDFGSNPDRDPDTGIFNGNFYTNSPSDINVPETHINSESSLQLITGGCACRLHVI